MPSFRKKFAAFAVWLFLVEMVMPCDAQRRGLLYWSPVQRATSATRRSGSSGDESDGGWDVFPQIFGDISPSPPSPPRVPPRLPPSGPPPEIRLNRWTQCYLEDAASECTACWITFGKGGGVHFGGCPPEISIQWDREPPKQMFADVDYEVAYTVRVGAGIRRAIVKQDNVDLPHSNIHSCFPTAGACTPFIQNTPGLATHTNEQEANLWDNGARRFTSVINLPKNRYTIIAHARFFVPSPSCRGGATEPDCLNKIDFAIGEQRRLRKAPPQPPVPPPPPSWRFRSPPPPPWWIRSPPPPPPWFPGPPPRCYLDATADWEDDSEETLCPVCWETPTNNPSIKAKIVHCPPGFELYWIKAPPKQLDRGKEYDVSYMVQIGDELDKLEAVQGNDISHANVHSCFASVKECTPSIADTPGLATHTDAQKDNVDWRGSTAFMSKIPQSLPPGEYTVIAHVRFFLRERGRNDGRSDWFAESRESNGSTRDGLMQYDAAIGLRRTVVGPEPSPPAPPSEPPPRCYLDAIGGEEDDDETLCPVCWETPTNDPSIKAKIVHCPPGFELYWIKAPPKQLNHGKDEYDVSYMVQIGDELDKLEAVQGNDISHANIHSCFASVKECTPSIADTPGLATHTDAQKDNLNWRGSTAFMSKIPQSLPPGEYTVIAHVRFFLRQDGNDRAAESSSGARDGLVQYDAAIGLRRTVAGSAAENDPPRCYLDATAEDEDEKEQETLCPVCWETPTNNPSIKAKIVHCPPGFELYWIKAPPKQLDHGKEYDVSYMVQIGDELDKLEAVQGNDISHANIHSCFASVKECTPSIADTPGLATHTDAQKDNLNWRGSTAFMSKIPQSLPPGEYTVIAHVRFFLRQDGNDRAAESSSGARDSTVQYDAAIGLRRTVAGSAAEDDPPRCYLDAIAEDEDEKEQETLCPVCWETPTNNPSIKAKIVHCPPGFELDWIEAPPKELDSDKEYNVSYMVQIGDELDKLEAVKGFDISHANVHSCFASVKECTPSIADTPGLATHTDAQKDNVNWRGSTAFMSKIPQLPPGEYTVIAHVRFFLRQGSSNGVAEETRESNGGIRDGLVQYDAAIGLRRTVKP